MSSRVVVRASVTHCATQQCDFCASHSSRAAMVSVYDVPPIRNTEKSSRNHRRPQQQPTHATPDNLQMTSLHFYMIFLYTFHCDFMQSHSIIKLRDSNADFCVPCFNRRLKLSNFCEMYQTILMISQKNNLSGRSGKIVIIALVCSKRCLIGSLEIGFFFDPIKRLIRITELFCEMKFHWVQF